MQSRLAFGNGDGGGGPLAPMLENLRRCRAIADEHGEIPKVTMGHTVDQFYEDILKKTNNGETLATWLVPMSAFFAKPWVTVYFSGMASCT